MRNLIIVIICLGLTQIFAITKEQNLNNDKFLLLLEENTIRQLELITAYNRNIARTPEPLKGEEIYSKFLLDLTMELSNIRKQIQIANSLSPEDKEAKIKEIIFIIRPDLDITLSDVDVLDQDNRKYLENIDKVLKERIFTLQKNIITEEKICLEKKEITKNLFSFQTHIYLYIVMDNYVSISQYLSKENRFYLTEIVKKIHNDLLKSTLQKEKK